jgi:hypothetical protein
LVSTVDGGVAVLVVDYLSILQALRPVGVDGTVGSDRTPSFRTPYLPQAVRQWLRRGPRRGSSVRAGCWGCSGVITCQAAKAITITGRTRVAAFGRQRPRCAPPFRERALVSTVDGGVAVLVVDYLSILQALRPVGVDGTVGSDRTPSFRTPYLPQAVRQWLRRGPRRGSSVRAGCWGCSGVITCQAAKAITITGRTRVAAFGRQRPRCAPPFRERALVSTVDSGVAVLVVDYLSILQALRPVREDGTVGATRTTKCFA